MAMLATPWVAFHLLLAPSIIIILTRASSTPRTSAQHPPSHLPRRFPRHQVTCLDPPCRPRLSSAKTLRCLPCRTTTPRPRSKASRGRGRDRTLVDQRPGPEPRRRLLGPRGVLRCDAETDVAKTLSLLNCCTCKSVIVVPVSL
jgi:hypothetical protein